jgi:putative peptidoglycan lipid II flippase
MASFFSLKSYKKALVFSTILNVLSKSIFFFNTILITYFFGINSSTDIFFFILSFSLLISSFINAQDSLVLVPEGMRIREQESDESSQAFFNFFFYVYLLFAIVFVTVVLINPILFFNFISKFNSKLLWEHYDMLIVGIFLITFNCINSFLSVIHNSYKQYYVSIIISALSSVFSILFTLLFYKTIGLFGTIIGITIGYGLNFFILIYLMVKKYNWNFFNVNFLIPKKVWKDIGLIQLNVLPIWIRNSIGVYMISGLGIGFISALSFGQQISSIVDIFLVTQLTSISVIKFSELGSKKLVHETNRVYQLILKYSLAITVSVSFFSMLMSKEIVLFLYNFKGEVSDSSHNIVIVFCFLIASLPQKIVASVTTALISAFQKIKNSIPIGIFLHSIVTIVMIVVTNKYGFIGYLFTVNLHLFVFFFFFYLILKKSLPFIEYGQVFNYYLKNVVLNLVAVLATYFGGTLLNEIALSSMAYLVVSFLFYFLFLLLINSLFRLNLYGSFKNILKWDIV